MQTISLFCTKAHATCSWLTSLTVQPGVMVNPSISHRNCFGVRNKWTLSCLLFNDGSQFINTGFKICVSTDDVNVLKTSGVIQHGPPPSALWSTALERCFLLHGRRIRLLRYLLKKQDVIYWFPACFWVKNSGKSVISLPLFGLLQLFSFDMDKWEFIAIIFAYPIIQYQILPQYSRTVHQNYRVYENLKFYVPLAIHLTYGYSMYLPSYSGTNHYSLFLQRFTISALYQP